MRGVPNSLGLIHAMSAMAGSVWHDELSESGVFHLRIRVLYYLDDRSIQFPDIEFAVSLTSH